MKVPYNGLATLANAEVIIKAPLVEFLALITEYSSVMVDHKVDFVLNAKIIKLLPPVKSIFLVELFMNNN